MKYLIGLMISVIGVMVMIWFALIERFLNPDMTATRLLYTFWWQYLLGALLLVGGYWITGSKK